jgi:hypothetical protein
VTVFSVDGNTSKIKGRVRINLMEYCRAKETPEEYEE